MRPVMKIWPWDIFSLEFDPDEDAADEPRENEIKTEKIWHKVEARQKQS